MHQPQPHDAAPPPAAERAHRAGEPSGEQPPAHDEASDEAPAAGEYAEDGPRPLGIAVERTGNAEVDARLARLADADGLGVGGHIEVYEDVHRGLRETLAALDRPSVTPRS
ncbi:hypothetical protein [Streptomyces sp. MP131-18]|uniref:hypothetical protein n=1 Tax=Streptomyces sp. MP131-18 TaxID=1857892 RepID=UPI00097C6F1B|nr:hypothetical protein [Streptomyces sp. MP131-18]ONK15322.1 hypothetical protein STBA_61380 [Streptomyces sp. MP131-18]